LIAGLFVVLGLAFKRLRPGGDTPERLRVRLASCKEE